MAATVESRKRSATPFLDEPVPLPPHLAKRGRFSPYAGAAPSLAPFDPLDALRRVFPDAGPGEIEACFAAAGRDVHAAVEAFRAGRRQAAEREAAAARLASSAARADGVEECAVVLVGHLAVAADVADARARAAWALKVVADAVAGRASAAAREEGAALGARAAALAEENAALRARAGELERDNGVLKRGVAAQSRRQEELERDNGVLKRGVAALRRREEEAERAAAELKRKVAELEMANYALGVRLGDADSCRFQAFRGI